LLILSLLFDTMPENFHFPTQQQLEELLTEMDEWIRDAKQKYISMNMEEIERKAKELEVTCDYIIMEFI
jgi:hypothetical protein